jgi:hypothetical protein
MPGLSFILINHAQIHTTTINNLRNSLCLDSHENLVVVKDLPHAKVVYSHHRNYPIQIFKCKNYFIIIEGMIYSNKETIVLENLRKIAEAFFLEKLYYKSLISEFVYNADGDFIIAISDTHCDNIVFFNDYLGRMPLYWSESDRMTIISRDIKTILEHSEHIRLRKSSIVDFITFGYFLGSKTFFDGVSKLYPSKIIEVKKTNNYSIRLDNSNEFNFVLTESFNSKKQSIIKLKDVFLESTKCRVNHLKEARYNMICDLSGGYDSRTILGGLSKFTNEITYFNFKYIRDESPWAKAIFEKLESPGKFEKLSFDNPIDYFSLNRLVYKTDGLVNLYSTAICYSDIKYLFNKNPNITARFGGLAGEFIRHPLKSYYKSIYWGIENGLYSSIKPEFACKMVNLNYKDYKEETIEYLASYDEKSDSDKLKHFYFEYYQNMVGGGAEDRERLHFWSVHPLWSNNFMRTILNQIPLDWTGFHFYIDFMKQINMGLLEVPIYDSNINLRSCLSNKMFDINFRKESYKRKNYLIFREEMNTFYRLYINHLKSREEKKNYAIEPELEYLFRNNIKQTISFFDKTLLENSWYEFGGQYNQLLTFMIYYNELLSRYFSKF